MHILLTTYGLLLIFALFTAAQWRSASDMIFMDTAAIESFADARKWMLKDLNKHTHDIYKKLNISDQKKSASPQPPAKVTPNEEVTEEPEEEDEEREPREPADQEEPTDKKTKLENCTSFLSLAELFRGENPNITDKKGRATFVLLKNLITELYKGQEFFEEAKEAIPDLEERFIMELYERAKEAQAEKQWIKSVKKLGKLKLDDFLMKHLRYKTFTGNKRVYDDETRDQAGYFPLTEFADMRQRKATIMSLWLAPKPLLMALFQNEETVEDLLQMRKEIYYEIKNHKSEASGKSNSLKDRYGSAIDLELVDFIDFQVTTTMPPDMPKGKINQKK